MLYISAGEIDAMEEGILHRRHIERYMHVRQFAYGTTFDVACGTGYGTYLLSKSEDVTTAIGFDMCESFIDEARKNFANISFERREIALITPGATGDRIPKFADTLVSLETIEHLEDPRQLANLAERFNIQQVILSFPKKKSAHYNHLHKWDFVPQDIADIFPQYAVVNTEVFASDTYIMYLIRTPDNEIRIKPKRWNRRNETTVS